MTTEAGRRFVANRLNAARNLSELAAVWASIAVAYQREPQIFELKERLKAQMEQQNEQQNRQTHASVARLQ